MAGASAVALIHEDHSPMSPQWSNPIAVGAAAQQSELCIRVDRVEVKGGLRWLSDNQRASSGGHKY